MKLQTPVNPFGAPLYYFETLSSTMDEARRLAARGEVHGTVVLAGFQEAGRGRTPGRSWQADRGKNLFCTIILRYPGYSLVPQALTLRTGLALALAIEDFAPALTGKPRVKWPNDIMLGNRKTAGILTEGDGSTFYIGIGVNVAQTEFPEALRHKAVSIAMALGETAAAGALDAARSPGAPRALLGKILARLHREISPEGGVEENRPHGRGEESWRDRLEPRLYMKGQQVRFMAGAAGAAEPVEGVLEGIGPEGELLIIPPGESAPRSFVTGELAVY
jgi:BirA family biotin operon repressor/biotin-[acetyl-CoA-carboxylase] ligase